MAKNQLRASKDPQAHMRDRRSAKAYIAFRAPSAEMCRVQAI